jgi:hypothetical protein
VPRPPHPINPTRNVSPGDFCACVPETPRALPKATALEVFKKCLREKEEGFMCTLCIEAARLATQKQFGETLFSGESARGKTDVLPRSHCYR